MIEIDSYNSSGQLSEVDRTGYASTFYTYDALSSVTRSGTGITNPAGPLSVTSMDRIVDSDRRLQVDTDNQGNVTNTWLRAETTTYPIDNSSTPVTTYTLQKVITSATSTVQDEIHSFDAEGNESVKTTATSRATKTVTVTTKTPGCLTDMVETTTNGLLTSVKGHDGFTTTSTYDGLDRLSTVIDPRGNQTKQTYISGTNLIQSVYDAAALTQTPPYAVRTFTYDGLARPRSVTDANGGVVNTRYNLRGQTYRQWGTGCDPIQYVYDTTYGDRTEQDTYRASGTFDDSNWPASGDAVTWSFDSGSGLLKSKTYPAADANSSSHSVQYTYNSRYQLSTLTNARGNVATYSYYGDATGEAKTGELESISYNDGMTSTVTYAYTRGSQLHTVTEGFGARTLTYDSGHPQRLKTEQLPAFFGSRTLAPVYEAATSPGVNPGDAGTVTGRLAGIQLEGVSQGTGVDLQETASFNNLNRVSAIGTQSFTNTAETFTYKYDSADFTGSPAFHGLVTGYKNGNAKLDVTIGYDSYRDLPGTVSASWSASNGTTVQAQNDYTYDYLGQRLSNKLTGTAFGDYHDSGTLHQAVYDYYAHNTRGEIETTTMYRGDSVPASPLSTDELPGRRFEYRYDNAGNRTSVGPVAPGGKDAGALNDAYTANALNQYSSKTNMGVRVLGTANETSTVAVAGAVVGQLERAFGATLVPPNPSGPAFGSVTISAQSSASPPAVVQQSASWFIPSQAQSFTYDADGNLTNDGVWSYTYDFDNRLTQMKSVLPAGQNFTRLQLDFQYDYLDRRVEKKVTNLDTSAVTSQRRYIYNGSRLLAEVDTSGTVLRYYTWGIDLGGTTGGPGVGGLLRVTYFNGQTEANYYPTSDGNGNVTTLIKAADGSVAAAYEYGAFGESMRRELIDSTGQNDPNPFQFSTYFTDPETGYVYYGRRYYSPLIGRFVNRDPAEESGGVNLYGFCGNNGIDRFDTLGMENSGGSDTVAGAAQQPAIPLGPFVTNGSSLPNFSFPTVVMSLPGGSTMPLGIYYGPTESATVERTLQGNSRDNPQRLSSPTKPQQRDSRSAGLIDQDTVRRALILLQIALGENSVNVSSAMRNADVRKILQYALRANEDYFDANTVVNFLEIQLGRFNSGGDPTVLNNENLQLLIGANENLGRITAVDRFMMSGAGSDFLFGATAILSGVRMPSFETGGASEGYVRSVAAETRPALELLGRDGLDIGEARAGMTFEDLRAAGYSYTERMSKARFAKEFADVPTEGLRNTLIDYVNIEGDNYIVGGNSRLRAGIQYNLTDNLTFREVQLPYQNYETIDDVIQASLNYRGR